MHIFLYLRLILIKIIYLKGFEIYPKVYTKYFIWRYTKSKKSFLKAKI